MPSTSQNGSEEHRNNTVCRRRRVARRGGLIASNIGEEIPIHLPCAIKSKRNDRRKEKTHMRISCKRPIHCPISAAGWPLSLCLQHGTLNLRSCSISHSKAALITDIVSRWKDRHASLLLSFAPDGSMAKCWKLKHQQAAILLCGTW